MRDYFIGKKFLNGRELGDNLILSCMRATNYGEQYTFLTQKSCDLLLDYNKRTLTIDEKEKNIRISNQRARAMEKTINEISEIFPQKEEGNSCKKLLELINKNHYEWDTLSTDNYKVSYDVADINNYDWREDK